MLVEIYRNLHKNALSVRDPFERRVIAHADTVLLLNATFRVSEAGRQRVLRYKAKNVHAVVRGLLSSNPRSAPPSWRRIRYDPYTTPTFVWADSLEPVHSAPAVYIGPEGIFAAALVPSAS